MIELIRLFLILKFIGLDTRIFIKATERKWRKSLQYTGSQGECFITQKKRGCY